MTEALRILSAYLVGALCGFAIYVALFAVPIGGEILFYRGVVLALVGSAVLSTLLVLVNRRIALDLATRIGIVFTSLAFNVCFLVLFPVTIDRSISVFLLSRIADQQPLTSAALQDRFTNEYLGTMNQIPRRVHEQTLSGNLTLDQAGRIRLTDRGARFVSLAKMASGWFHTDPRFVDPAAESAGADHRFQGAALGKK